MRGALFKVSIYCNTPTFTFTKNVDGTLDFAGQSAYSNNLGNINPLMVCASVASYNAPMCMQYNYVSPGAGATTATVPHSKGITVLNN